MEIVFLFFSFLSWKVTICFKELVRVLPELLKLLGASSLGDLQHTVLLTQGPALSMVTISLVCTSLKRGCGGGRTGRRHVLLVILKAIGLSGVVDRDCARE